MYEIWQQLSKKHNPEKQISKQIFDIIQKSYTSSRRFYHNLEHIRKMLMSVQPYILYLKHPDILYFAIWFHDIVYNPLRKDNEKKSAQVAKKQLLKLGIDAFSISEICNNIERTATHFEHFENESPELKLLLDADLETLGSAPEVYDLNTRNIRKEYAIIPDSVFNAGRAKVLQKFLDMPQIYRTPAFFEKYETQARHNLNNELDTLIIR